MTHGSDGPEVGGRQVAEVGEPALADRCQGAVWGQFVGDAACLGSHWIYDLAELARRFPGGLQGFEAPAAGHYHAGKMPGEFTHYGDGALVMLRSVAELGRFDPADFGRRFVELFGGAYGGYLDHATRETLVHYRAFRAAQPDAPYAFQDGADDDQPATATRLVPVVIAHLADGALNEAVTAATRVCQNNGRAVAYMKCHALILRRLFQGEKLEGAVLAAGRAMEHDPAYGAELRDKIETACDSLPLEVGEVTRRFGQSCPLASSFPAAIHCAIRHDGDFAAAILATAAAGGDSAGRAALIGAWLGARHGLAGVPAAWRERLAAREEIAALTDRLVARALS